MGGISRQAVSKLLKRFEKNRQPHKVNPKCLEYFNLKDEKSQKNYAKPTH